MEAATPKQQVERQTRGVLPTDPAVDTRYAYRDASGKQVVLENSLPRGGLTYTDPTTGRKYVYAVFWSRIVNETALPLTVSIQVPADSFRIADKPAGPVGLAGKASAHSVKQAKQAALPHNYFRIVLPTEEMSPKQARLFNYGLKDLKAVLDYKLPQLTALQRTIPAKASGFMYVVILANRGVEGTVRAGFSVKNNKLYYRVNGEEIDCGPSPGKNLTLVPSIGSPNWAGGTLN